MLNRQQLLALHPKGSVLKCLFFWGHSSSKHEKSGPFVLSQWFHSPFRIDDILFPTAEHYMMWSKAKLFLDSSIQNEILQHPSPKIAKACGRKVQHFNQKIWDLHKVAIVLRANLAKFSQNPVLGEFLIHSQSSIIVEASPYDRIWGIGKKADPSMCDPHNWEGENLLGFILMEVRNTLTSKHS